MDLSDIFGGDGPEKDEWVVVARDDKKQPVSLPDELSEEDRRFKGDPTNKETWRHEHGDLLEPGVAYYCVRVRTDGYNFDDPAWVLEVEEGRNEVQEVSSRVQREISDLKERFEEQEMQEHPFLDVSDTDELQAKAAGAGMLKAMKEGDMDDFKEMFVMVNQQATQPASNPMAQVLGSVESDMKVESITDLAMLTALPELQDMMGQGKELISNVNNLAGSMGGAAAPQQQQAQSGQQQQTDNDTVQVSREEFERLKAQAQGDDPSEPIDSPDDHAGGDDGSDDDSFSMDEIAEAAEEAEIDAESDTEEAAESDDEPDEEANLDGEELTVDGGTHGSFSMDEAEATQEN